MKIYGIKNCDSVKKALGFLDDHKIAYQFCDYKKQPADRKLIADFILQFGLEKVLNKKGTSFRKLSATEQESTALEKNAIDLMVKNNSLIKRPIVIGKNLALIGFDEDLYSHKII